MRTFTASTATRRRTHVLLGLSGPSGSGKTKSALRVATGMVRAFGGKIGLIDTEADRALHYAPAEGEKADPARGTYDFLHVPFQAPFGPLDYLAALEYARGQGCTVIIVDSMSHEHEGPGGVLEMHEAEVQRLMQAWKTNNPDVVKMPAWGAPKRDRRRLINGLLQMPVSFIFCFRAKEKIRIPGKDERDEAGRKAKPSNLGYLPIAGEEFVFEQTANLLLLPGAKGKPEWEPEEPGEKALVKVPEYLEHAFPKQEQLSEATGETVARWAMGGAQAKAEPSLKRGTPASPDAIEDVRRALMVDLKMPGPEVKAWLAKYFGVTKGQELTPVAANAALQLARVMYESPGDDAAFAEVYDRLKAEGAVL